MTKKDLLEILKLVDKEDTTSNEPKNDKEIEAMKAELEELRKVKAEQELQTRVKSISDKLAEKGLDKESIDLITKIADLDALDENLDTFASIMSTKPNPTLPADNGVGGLKDEKNNDDNSDDNITIDEIQKLLSN